jgi:succinate dehydrogenase / fumarate reductase flavoprotein subunit
VHPTAIPGADKCRLMSESARGEGGRIWVPRTHGDHRDPRQIPENERWYFLEEKYPKYGNLVPRDIATREIFDVCVNHGLGVGGGNMVYLDLTHKPKDYLETKLGGILEIYRKFAGDDPTEVPMKIFPAVHYTMGGMWTTYTPKDDRRGMVRGAPNTMMTNIQGLYALGEVSYQYHGATRLGANALLSCTFDGLFSGSGIAEYVRNEPRSAGEMDASMFDAALKQEDDKQKRLVGSSGTENPYEIARELGVEMTAASTVIKEEKRMLKAVDKLHELQDRYRRVGLSDLGSWTNQNLGFARATGDMLLMAEVILQGGIDRKESRGSHARSDYTERVDEKFLKTTVAEFDAGSGRPKMRYEDIIMGLVEPRARTYGKVEGDGGGDDDKKKTDKKSKSSSKKEPAGASG